MSYKLHKTNNDILLKVLKVAHENFTLEWRLNTTYTNGMFWLLGVGCTSRAHTQYKRRLAKDWKRPTKRAIMAKIMHSDKTLLI